MIRVSTTGGAYLGDNHGVVQAECTTAGVDKPEISDVGVDKPEISNVGVAVSTAGATTVVAGKDGTQDDMACGDR